MWRVLVLIVALALAAGPVLAIPLKELPNPDNYRLLDEMDKSIRGEDGEPVVIHFALMISMDGKHQVGFAYYKGQLIMVDPDANNPDAPVLIDSGFCPGPNRGFPPDGKPTGDFVRFSQCPQYKRVS